MAFGFFKDKNKGPFEVSCPICQNVQQESRLAVSSYCKKCGAYLTFDRQGGVKARPLNPPDPFADRPPQADVVVDYSPRVAPEAEPPRSPSGSEDASDVATTDTGPGETGEENSELASEAEEDPDAPSQEGPDPPSQPSTSQPDPDRPFQPEPKHPSPSGSSPHRFQGASASDSSDRENIETREVACFECGDSHPANVLANSTQCRKCGRLISMADHEIQESSSRPIQTRGNVHIHKKGQVRSAPIECHDLIVEGDFSGDARCTGDLVIRRNGHISGQIRCRRLLVERRARVDFQGPVEMEEGRIDGLVTGNLTCRGLLALEKKAVLTGNLKVGRLAVADGAKHHGQIRMGAF